MNSDTIQKSYDLARQRYADLGVDSEAALKALATVPVSLHSWQGDDVGGFETPDAELGGGGIQATGNYPGKARTPEQLRADLDKALSLIPGTHRLNLHAIYGEFGGKQVDRDAITSEHYAGWIDWAKQRGMGMDFNPTCFSHPKADSGLTLSHPDKSIRDFWIAHCRACREIGSHMGKALGSPSVVNIWIPDGYKDIPVDRMGPRQRLVESLDAVFKTPNDPTVLLDAVESKLFGIGSEAYVVGSHEFYMGYAVKRGTLLCLDSGHFHPTEVISDKLSAVLCWVDDVLLHVSRGVRWDSDHVVILSDELRAIAQQLVRSDLLNRVHIGLDFFDASINRVAAWVIGTRAMLKALLLAMLEPTDMLVSAENDWDFTTRLAMLEEAKSLPFGAVWDYYCIQQDTPAGEAWLGEVKAYEKQVLADRT